MRALVGFVASILVLAGAPALAQQGKGQDVGRQNAPVPETGVQGGPVPRPPPRPGNAAEAARMPGAAPAVSGIWGPQPDPAAGRHVVETGGRQAQACVSCHGLDGTGDTSGAFPLLTGQSGWYLYKQLKDYASGARPNDTMAPIAQALSDEEMRDVA